MKIFLLLLVIMLIGGTVDAATKTEQRFMGRLFRAVQSDDSLWYVSPKDGKRYSIRSETDALDIIQKNLYTPSKGEQILPKVITPKTAGKFIHNPANSTIYYADPIKKKLLKIGKAEESFNPLWKLAIGISNKDLNKIPLSPAVPQGIQQLVSPLPTPQCNGTMCAGKCWSSCSGNQDFICTESGASCKNRETTQNQYEKTYSSLVYSGKSAEARQFLQANRQYFDPNFVSMMDKIERAARPQKSATECIDDFNKAVGGGPVMDSGTITSIIRMCNGQYDSSLSYPSNQEAQLSELQRRQEEQSKKLEALKKEQEDSESRDRLDCLLSSKGIWYSGRCNY